MQRENSDAAGIELPVGDAARRRDSSERQSRISSSSSYTQSEVPLMMVCGAVVCELGDLAAGNFFHVNIIGANVSDFRAVRREFGEHQRRGGGVAAEFSQRSRLQIEHPVIAAGVAGARPARNW